jgi:mannan endo-1,4-beta-mannosidase
MKLNQLTIYLLLLVIISSCHSSKILTADQKSTSETRKLYNILLERSEKGIMIGYEDALAYGIGWKEEEGMCDMYRSSGEYPAVYGWDIGDIHKNQNLDTVSFSKMINWIKKVHLMGGINTISWHMDNPVTGASSWDKSKIALQILPGGEAHDRFLNKLDRAAILLKNCKINNTFIPIIFRPFHEHNGDWFWWGKGNVSESEYIELYQFIANYFKSKHKIHHLIYAFSPDRSRITNLDNEEDYLYGYPGDEYVDLIGLDNYKDMDINPVDSLDQKAINNFIKSLEMVTEIATNKGKLSALTETGNEGIKDNKWFTKKLLNPLLKSEKAQKISYILMWRNANTSHHYMVYPEHPVKDDFIEFINHPLILTLSDVGSKKWKFYTKAH